MTEKIDLKISQLLNYALENGLIEAEDIRYSANRLLEMMQVSDFTYTSDTPKEELHVILDALCDYAAQRGIIEENTVTYRDLFDTKLMGELTPRPSEVIRRFDALYAISPADATDYFYGLCRSDNYIRTDRIAKDVKWTYSCGYGDIDITINLSKPEKDPKAIAAAKLLPQSGYPKCALCPENEGFAGNSAKPARQNIRLIPITMAGTQWYMQYSPYVYYNEHCIALSSEHVPMKVDRSTFVKLLDFISVFPHYFLGSNADLPIVGGSILSHDHMQGGRYTFAMEKAPIEKEIVFGGFENVKAGIVHWPMSVIRLRSDDREALTSLADKILKAWRAYSDPDCFIFAETDGQPHNTVTPIARMRNGEFELDLVLRNNITSEEHPLGVFHPHAELHNIKKENIGLIEVMGLAVLPARLKDEMALVRDAVLAGRSLDADERTSKHKTWFESFAAQYDFNADNTDEILKKEIGKTFVRVLEDAGVYKRTREGQEGFMRFVDSVK
ncbi:MAG: UDP-glucose--hexose-1-phosphate uridylyltransferase [Eubacteriales bacterium]